MIGGIAANNASGMCCGTAQNSYQTVDSIRIVLADGTVLDTGDDHSRAAFQASHGPMLARLDEPLAQLFGELKDKLHRLLTDAQRRAAEAEAEPAADKRHQQRRPPR